MTTQAFTYINIDAGNNLDADYGGATILAAGDSAEPNKLTLHVRHVFTQIDYLTSGTRNLGQAGLVSGVTWLELTTETYNTVSSYLPSAVTATATTTRPVGFTDSGGTPHIPHPTKINVWGRGDSISDNTSAGSKDDNYMTVGINLIDGESLSTGDTRPKESDNYYLYNFSLGSSSWANTVGVSDDYPQREDLAFNQRVATIPFDFADRVIFHYALGSNDLAYDATLTGEQCWTRAETRIDALRARFPNIIIMAGTIIRRANSDVNTVDSFHHKANIYNDLLRASDKVDVVCDIEANVAPMNFVTGISGGTANSVEGTAEYYYNAGAGDTIHPGVEGHAVMAVEFNRALLEAVALL